MVVITDIFEDIVKRVSEKYGKHVNFQFGDWEYISGVLQTWSSSRDQAKKKYPVICLFSPFPEEKDEINGGSTAVIDFLIAKDTMPEYSNEKRRDVSFKQVLQPIYELFIQEIAKEKRFDPGFTPSIPHTYIENYRYGRIGVNGPDGTPFKDKIDAIDIKNLSIKIKKQKCYANRI